MLLKNHYLTFIESEDVRFAAEFTKLLTEAKVCLNRVVAHAFANFFNSNCILQL